MDTEGATWAVFENQFMQGNQGRHMAMVLGMDNWAFLDDESSNFREAFEKIHGEGTHQSWVREMGDVFIDAYDEVWTVMPELSTAGNE